MIAIIDTGCANINSVKFAFERLGVAVDVIGDPALLNNYDRAILPGVGHAKVAMARLKETGWDTAIKNYGKPLLGICLGMQLLCEFTEEGDVDTLGFVPGKLTQMRSETLALPHMGWNKLNINNNHPILAGLKGDEYVYYVHSFAHEPNQYTVASSHYEDEFSAIISNKNVVGMQFHPERSAKVGAQLLLNFLNWQPA